VGVGVCAEVLSRLCSITPPNHLQVLHDVGNVFFRFVP
jgi:hypothetical protein